MRRCIFAGTTDPFRSDFEALAQEKTLWGRFIRILNERIADASDAERCAERARMYGLEALSGREGGLMILKRGHILGFGKPEPPA